MNTLSYKTISANKSTVQKEWVLVDASDQVLGRLATRVAFMLRGKHKTNFTPHVDCGDNVIVVNADKVRLTGNKFTDRLHFSYTGYPGGQKRRSPKDLSGHKPESLVEQAVRGMLPKNRLGRAIFRNLYVYTGPNHPHEAQQPQNINLNETK